MKSSTLTPQLLWRRNLKYLVFRPERRLDSAGDLDPVVCVPVRSQGQGGLDLMQWPPEPD